MKTTYQKPETKTIIVCTHKMVCTSPVNAPIVSGSTDNPDLLLSRERNDIWGDDDEE